jgi:hypothetical protein
MEQELEKILNGETDISPYSPPFRVGRKLNRAVLDKHGNQVVVFEAGLEIYAAIFVCLLNKHLA